MRLLSFWLPKDPQPPQAAEPVPTPWPTPRAVGYDELEPERDWVIMANAMWMASC